MKLGLFGGAFNPIHRCHLQVAEAVRCRLALDTILFIPTGDPPHKPSTDVFPASHRLEMVRLAIAPYPYFQLSDIETRRPAKSYSIDTVREIKATAPPETQLVFILGLDAFLDLPEWRDPDRLLAACDFAVVSRPGSRFASLAKLPFLVSKNPALLERLDRSEGTVAELPLSSGRTLWAIAIPPCPISAKDIRNRLNHKQSLENLLPPPVESYILKHLISGGSPL
jgi:nicotinate-nucleotide adenylyltransferase